MGAARPERPAGARDRRFRGPDVNTGWVGGAVPAGRSRRSAPVDVVASSPPLRGSTRTTSIARGRSLDPGPRTHRSSTRPRCRPPTHESASGTYDAPAEVDEHDRVG